MELEATTALRGLSVRELKAFITARGGSYENVVEKEQLLSIAASLRDVPASTREQIAFDKGDAQALNELAGITPSTVFDQGQGFSCGRVFRKGELAYHCRNCQNDDTCVMCKTCFDNSNHEGHDWSHYVTGAGGCCDCGDFEAWAREGCCPEHSAPRLSDPTELLPAAVVDPSRAVMARVVDKLVAVAADVGVSFNRALPTTEFDTDASGQFTFVVHNDDVHTFREVEMALARALGPGLAMPEIKHATDLVNRQGRAPVATVQGLAAARDIAERMRPAGLLISIAKPGQLEGEKAAVALVDWLIATCDKSPGFIRVLLNELLKPASSSSSRTCRLAATPWMRQLTGQRAPRHWAKGESALVSLVYMHALLPKLLALRLNDLFMRCLKDDAFKVELGCAIGVALPDLHALYAAGLGVNAESIHNISVQLFTASSVVHEFARKRGGVPLLFQVLEGLRSAYEIASNRAGEVSHLDRQMDFLAGGGALAFGGAGGGGGDDDDDGGDVAEEDEGDDDDVEMEDQGPALVNLPIVQQFLQNLGAQPGNFTGVLQAFLNNVGAPPEGAPLLQPYLAAPAAEQQQQADADEAEYGTVEEEEDDDDDDDEQSSLSYASWFEGAAVAAIAHAAGDADGPPELVGLTIAAGSPVPSSPQQQQQPSSAAPAIVRVDPLHRYIYHHRFVHAQLDFKYVVAQDAAALLAPVPRAAAASTAAAAGDAAGRTVLDLALQVLARAHGLDAVRRHQGREHVLHQRAGWQEAVMFSEFVQRHFVTPLAAALGETVAAGRAHPMALARIIAAAVRSAEGSPALTDAAWFDGTSARVYADSVLLSTATVSFHLPLHRTAGALFASLVAAPASPPWSFDEIACLVDAPLRVWACVAQERAGLWRRDGDAIVQLSRVYHLRSLRVLALDLAVLQLAANALEPTAFVALAAQRYGVLEWMQRRPPAHGDLGGHVKADESDFVHSALLEEFVGMLIALCSYLPRDVPAKVLLHVVHVLAVSGQEPFSKLLDECESIDDAVTEAVVDSAVRQVADVNGALCALKPEAWALVDAGFFFLSRSQQETLLERLEKHTAGQRRPAAPRASDGSPVFPRAREVRESRAVLLGVVRGVLLDAGTPRCSARLLGLAVRLLSLVGHDISDAAWAVLTEQSPSIVELCVEVSHKQYNLVRRRFSTGRCVGLTRAGDRDRAPPRGCRGCWSALRRETRR